MTAASTAVRSPEPAGDRPSLPELVERARALQPILRDNAARTEADRGVAPEVAKALRDSGMFRLTTPARYGGYELSIREVMTVLREVGRGCASTGWTLSIDTASTLFAYGLPETALADVFADTPDAFVLSTSNLNDSRARRVDGGYVVSGRFPWSSGCEITDWAYIGVVPLHVDGAPTTDLVTSVIPMSDLTIERTWDCAGLAGSGTHTVIADEVFVPERRTLLVNFTPEALPDEDERNTAIIAGSAQSLAGMVGSAEGALEVVSGLLAKKPKITFTTLDSMVDSSAIRIWFAEATHLIETAVLHMEHAASALDGVAPADPVPWVERARIRMHLTSAQQKAREGIEKLLDVVGGRAFARSNPLQRYWRDLAVIGRHNSLNAPVVVEDYSRALLAVRPTITVIH
ncbi:acyl-CoA dehydrogenase family protein [Saccharothrix australiensis]|uniref:Alkylation response protein AidB-like acyl-CoA dehydrogenase n=1 Tax=Saccharothrix australiensis TaxID=2072 RepID=A0A495VX82_9PSEU|nr:acyl-CoA dehydrogenase family protein [Saccharothrix australiensis]RKT53859.1 alkylation response protein AidB-like acyl-CoA dehydrogenase [Saccharothrix australiensis]